MRIGRELRCFTDRPFPVPSEKLLENLDPEWISDALAAEGVATLRKRRLPAEHIVPLVVGMALLRDRSIVDVVDALDLGLPGSGPISSAVVTARRDFVGPEPLERLYRQSAQSWVARQPQERQWRGLSVLGVDGTVLRVPDSPDNRKFFGAARNGTKHGGAYPLLRLVALIELRTHLVLDVRFGPYSKAEMAYARDLFPAIPNDSVTIVDRLYLAADLLMPLTRGGTGRHFLVRARADTQWTVVRKLSDHELLVEMRVSKDARKRDPSLPESWTVRAIHYRRKGFPPQWLLTSLLDHVTYPADEIVDLYHARWECELAFDEIKTETLDREEALRSTSPARVAQEVWGLLLAYNIVRFEMAAVADTMGVDPNRISYVAALHLVCDELLWASVSAPGAIPRHFARMQLRLQRMILPPRRSERAYARAVKLPRSSYPSLGAQRRPATVK